MSGRKSDRNKKDLDRPPRVTLLDVPIHSPRDSRKYRAIRLRNGLKALLVEETVKPSKKVSMPFHLEESDSEEEEDDEKDNEEKKTNKNKSTDSKLSKNDKIKEIKRKSACGVSNPRSIDKKSSFSPRSSKMTMMTKKATKVTASTGKDPSSRVGSSNTGKNNNESFDEEEGYSAVAAVGLTVGVGAFSDTDDVQGLAHLLEHAVFLGTEEYPDDGEFDSFLARYGGSSNASTDLEMTTFQFEVDVEALKRSLERFAQ